MTGSGRCKIGSLEHLPVAAWHSDFFAFVSYYFPLISECQPPTNQQNSSDMPLDFQRGLTSVPAMVNRQRLCGAYLSTNLSASSLFSPSLCLRWDTCLSRSFKPKVQTLAGSRSSKNRECGPAESRATRAHL